MAEDRLVIAVLEVCPDALLAGGHGGKGGRVAEVGCPPGERADESGAEEDGEDAEVLGVVVYEHFGVPCAESILNVRAEVVRERHCAVGG